MSSDFRSLLCVYCDQTTKNSRYEQNHFMIMWQMICSGSEKAQSDHNMHWRSPDSSWSSLLGFPRKICINWGKTEMPSIHYWHFPICQSHSETMLQLCTSTNEMPKAEEYNIPLRTILVMHSISTKTYIKLTTMLTFIPGKYGQPANRPQKKSCNHCLLIFSIYYELMNLRYSNVGLDNVYVLSLSMCSLQVLPASWF